MKSIILAISAVFMLTACSEVVSRTETYELTTVTKFNKVNKRQRISFVMDNGEVHNDFYISKRCTDCNINVGEKLDIKVVTVEWDDGKIYKNVDASFIKEQLTER